MMVINESVNSFFNMILLQLVLEFAQHNSNNRGSKILGYAAPTQLTSVLRSARSQEGVWERAQMERG
jgi:hypothetical protein